jgi:hypothetical protein
VSISESSSSLKVNRPLSRQLRQDIEARPKECWLNALSGLYMPWFQGEVYYVEGLLKICEGLWIEHGWLQINGEIVDPTLDDQGDDTYHAIFRYERSEVWTLLNEYEGAHRWPFYERDRDKRQIVHKAQMELYEKGAC